ncbi:MAG: acyltransferase family protein [Acidimicrobiia bacterium]|nr:acyltransferase family protein [Acidimicrobiia bacterium]
MLNPQDAEQPERSIPETNGSTAPNSGPTSTGTSSLAGAVCLVAVAANLGLPGINQPVAMTILLTVVGYGLARAIHRNVSTEPWRAPLILGLAARVFPAVLLVATLSGLYGLIIDGGLASSESLALLSAITFTSNIVPFVTGAGYPPVEHFWVVALVAQAALVAPWLLTCRSDRLDRRRRAFLLLAGAAALSLFRLIAIATTDGAAWVSPYQQTGAGLTAASTSLDGLLVGLAVGTVPLASLHRHPTTKIVVPMLVGLTTLLVVPPVGGSLVTTGLGIPLAAALTGSVLAAAAIFSLPKSIDGLLANPWLHRLSTRSFGLYLWHIPFAFGVAGANPFQWHGPVVFVVVLTLSLAAASTTYRSIELPALTTFQWVERRWFPGDVIILTNPTPQRDKWRRWDEISLDDLPRPPERRNPSLSAGRLWQHGDCTARVRPEANPETLDTPDDSALAG